MRAFPDPLPIDDVLPRLRQALAQNSRAVLVAPPGAGKTTRVPLALLDAPFVHGRKILVLEPRRLAARAAAQRMASTLGEKVGETIGLRVRLQSLVSSSTRIEVVTEGVFSRMILDDPSLEGVAAVLFDEFHERSLDADLGLALALDAQGGLREDLRILVMSATLDGERVAALMEGAASLVSEGFAFPVETRYAGRDPVERIEEAAARAILTALGEEPGSILAFLPGQGEILRVQRILEQRVKADNVDIAPLYGALDFRAQDLAVAPARKGRRKIVLATSIAETSLTIEGVRVVVDSGFMRVPRFEPDIGVTRLETVRVARANADQRRGRAGRIEPGVCYRLWEAAANGGLRPFAPPENFLAPTLGAGARPRRVGRRRPGGAKIPRSAAARGVRRGARAAASFGALDDDGRVTNEGRAMARLALPPRLARAVIDAARENDGLLAAEIAVAITERGLGGDAVDLAERLAEFRREKSQRGADARRLAKNLAERASKLVGPPTAERNASVGFRLAQAFPDRIALARGKRGEFLMANGRAAALEPHERLAGEPTLAIGEIVGRAGSARILTAAPLAREEIEAVAGESIETHDELTFDRASASLRARRRRRLGALVLSEQALPAPADMTSAEIFAHGVIALGIDRLPWSKALKQWRDRVMFLRRAEPGEWPDLSDEALKASPDWLALYLLGKTSLAEIGADDLSQALRAQLHLRKRGGSTRKLPPTSSPRPARRRP